MRIGQVPSRTIGAVTVAIIVVIGWLLLAPTSLGGDKTYLLVSGASMLPTFRTGDLVVVRRAVTYAVGDVAAYYNPELGAVVLHRIVDVEGDRLVLQGDNNQWRDHYRPAPADMLGQLWLRLPGVGRWLETLRAPRHLAVVTSILVVSFMLLDAQQEERRVRTVGRRRRHGAPAVPRPGSGSGGWVPAPAGLIVCGALLAASVVLGILAYRSPLTRTSGEKLPYTHAGEFSYSGQAADTLVYPDGRVDTGEPAFLRLVPSLDVRFIYRFHAQQVEDVRGVASMTAQLQGASGWNRTFELTPSRPFEGNEVELTGQLALRELAALAAQVRASAGLQGDDYTLIVRPHIALEGGAGGVPFSDEFAPALTFRFRDVALTPAGDRGEGTDVFHPAQQGFVDVARDVPNTLVLRWVSLDVLTARRAALVTFLLALAGLVASMYGLLRERLRSEPARIRARYGGLLLEAQDLALDDGRRVVWLTDFASLVRLAQHHERLILHQRTDQGHHDYAVQDNECFYAYRVAARDDQDPAPVAPARDPQAVS